MEHLFCAGSWAAFGDVEEMSLEQIPMPKNSLSEWDYETIDKEL